MTTYTASANYAMFAAHAEEASFACPSFMEQSGLIVLGTIMVSIFIFLGLPTLALLIGIGIWLGTDLPR